jgi:hypothetical protein
MAAVAAAAKDGTLRIDDELHLTPLAAEEEDPLNRIVHSVQRPETVY